MATQREKILSYRRAEWPTATGTNLEKCISNALKALPTIDDRSLFNGPQCARVAKHEDGKTGGLFLHITTETPGEAASVVPKVASNAQELSVKTEAPPPDGEWLDGDAFLYVRENHVSICATALRDGAISFFLRELMRKAKLP